MGASRHSRRHRRRLTAQPPTATSPSSPQLWLTPSGMKAFRSLAIPVRQAHTNPVVRGAKYSSTGTYLLSYPNPCSVQRGTKVFLCAYSPRHCIIRRFHRTPSVQPGSLLTPSQTTYSHTFTAQSPRFAAHLDRVQSPRQAPTLSPIRIFNPIRAPKQTLCFQYDP